MESGFWEEAADGTMKSEETFIKSINKKIDDLNHTLTNYSNSDKILIQNINNNFPISIGGVNCTVTKNQYSFGDGAGGIIKTVNANIYETPDGTKFVFPDIYNKHHQTMTPEI